MRPHTLSVKRRPVAKGVFKRLSAVTRNRKQRVAATATAAEHPESGAKISRALTIIFIIHIVAIGLIFFHQKFLDHRSVEAPDMPKAMTIAPAMPEKEKLPMFSNGDPAPYLVKTGDNYPIIARTLNVSEAELRNLNDNRDIRPGSILRLPPKRIVAIEPPEVAAIRAQAPSDADRGLVEAIPVDAPRAQIVKPNIQHDTSNAPKARPVAEPAAASGRTYVVQPGDSVWRIANKFKIDQNTLMKANGISDPKKMRTGMELSIP